MVEIKDKVVTVESLAVMHTYNKNAYMPKVENAFALIDLGETPLQYNPNDFIGFILEIEDDIDEPKQIIFTSKTSNNATFDVKAQTSLLDEDGDMLLYELYFYLENDEYIVKPTLTKIALSTGMKTTLSFSYTKLYGIKIV